ncbi:MAG: DUF4347 domain-containing protein, partial [Pseudomonadota bacterium]
MSRRPFIEPIEPRLLYSADFATAVLAHATAHNATAHTATTHSATHSATHNATHNATLTATHSASPPHLDALAAQPAALHALPRLELVVVDLAVPDASRLLADLHAQRQAGRPLDIVTLDPGTDGIARLTEALHGRRDVAAVHVIGHGADGVVQMGSTRLDAATLLSRAAELADWGLALADDADLLLYGCDVASSATGRQLVRDLAALTGADVAASTDPTGSAARGGNWTLEVTTGDIATPLAPTASAQHQWDGLLLTTLNVTRFDDTLDPGSLRWAIDQANANAGDFEIVLAAGTYQITQAGSGPTAGDFDITKTTGSLRIVGAGVGSTVISIPAGEASRIFDIQAGSLELVGLTLDGSQGDGTGEGGVIRVQAGAALTMT